MQDFPPNSHRAKARQEEPKKIDRVTSAPADRRKKRLGRQFKETFIGGSAKIAVEYMIVEVVIPAIQDTLIDAVQGGFERLIRGDERPRHRRSHTPSAYPASTPPRIAYNQMNPAARSPSALPPTLSRQARARQVFDEIVIPNRQEAEEVIDRMFDILSRYGTVSVADLYELTGIASTHTDHKWGWIVLKGAKASRLRSGGFLLDLPEPQPLG